MKQHITIKQLNELEYGVEDKLIDILGVYHQYDIANEMTIGKMIEIINNVAHLEFDIKKNFDTISESFINWSVEVSGYETVDSGFEVIKTSRELCDALWDAVKEVL